MSETGEYASARFVPLLEAIHELLRDYPIRSQIGSIRVMAEESSREMVMVNLAGGLSLATLARAVIEWHQTLDTATVAADRSDCGATLRLGLMGRSNNIDVEVWGEIPHDSDRTGLLIDPGQRTFLSVEGVAGWLVNEWRRGDNRDKHSDQELVGDRPA